jgi:MFS family permease
MVDRSWQGRALGAMESARSCGRLLGPLTGGWLLMFDLDKPIDRYCRTPFIVGALLCFVGAVLAFCIKKPPWRSLKRGCSRGPGRIAPPGIREAAAVLDRQ